MKSRSHMPGTGLSTGVRAGIAIAVLVGAYLIFEFGRIQADYNIADALIERREFAQHINGLDDQIAELKQEIARLENDAGD